MRLGLCSMLMHVWPEEKDSKASRNIIFGHISSRPSESYYVSDHVLFLWAGLGGTGDRGGEKTGFSLRSLPLSSRALDHHRILSPQRSHLENIFQEKRNFMHAEEERTGRSIQGLNPKPFRKPLPNSSNCRRSATSTREKQRVDKKARQKMPWKLSPSPPKHRKLL